MNHPAVGAAPRRGFDALTLLALVPMVWGLDSALVGFDPTQYAEVGRRMFLAGDPWLLRDNWGPFLNKGPLTFWLMCGAYAVLGFTSAAARLPSLLAALVAVWATRRIGLQLFSPLTGSIAAALLASMISLHRMVADPKVDAVLTACVTLALLCAVEARRRPWLMYLAWGFAGLGVLTKGPMGLAIPLVALAPEALRRTWGASESAPDGSVWRRLSALKPWGGLAVLLAITVPWYLHTAQQFGSRGPYFLLWEQSFARLVSSPIRNNAGPLFFVHTALWAYAPATLLVIAALWGRGRVWRGNRFGLPADERRVALWWLLVPFVAMSASSFKLPQYIFPLAPAAALLAAQWAAGSPAGVGRRGLERAGLGAGALLAVGVAVAAGWMFPAEGWLARLGWPLGAAAAAGFAWRLPGTGAPLRLIALWVLPVVAAQLFLRASVIPQLDRYQPDQTLGAVVRDAEPLGAPVTIFLDAGVNNGLAFYGRRDLRIMGLEELAERFPKGEIPFLVYWEEAEPQLLAAGLKLERLAKVPTFPTNLMKLQFLHPGTRDQAVRHAVLARPFAPEG